MKITDKVKGFNSMIQGKAKLKRVLVDNIDTDIMRMSLHRDRIESIKKGFKEGIFKAKENPITTFRVYGKHYINNDGNHRVIAFKELGKRYIYSEVIVCRKDKRRKKETYE